MQGLHTKNDGIFVQRRVVQESYEMPFYHIHGSFELFFLLHGHVHYLIEDKVFELHAGSMVIISPLLFHKTVYAPIEHERILVDIPQKFIEGILKYLDIDDPSQLLRRKEAVCLPGDPCLGSLCLSLVKEYTEKDAYYERRQMLLLADIIIHILRRRRENACSAPLGYRQTNTPIISGVTDYLSAHLDESITLSALSNTFHLERTYLCHIFKKSTGLTIWEYLQLRRIREACELLLYSTERITDVASAAGFSSIAHFERVFRKLVGCSPRQYRNQSVRNDSPF